MSVYCNQGELKFATVDKRNEVLGLLVNRVLGKERFGEDELSRGRSKDGFPNIGIGLRFTDRADQEDLNNFMNSLTGENEPLRGSFVSIHDCTHDDARADRVRCVEASRRTW